MKGRVYLVGAGPGDPGLITVRGKELIGRADTIVYDALLDPEILTYGPDALKIDAGKRGGNHTMSQDDINLLLLKRAEAGELVVRLKGGDPFLFGRGAEEAAFLRSNDIEVHVVPGVSSAIAVPELCGIPITHREISSSVTILTGHGKDDGNDGIDWKTLSDIKGTMVILMGIGNAHLIREGLLIGGKPPQTPVAVISDGSTSKQRSVLCDISSFPEVIEKAGLQPPGIIIVGDCARMMIELGGME